MSTFSPELLERFATLNPWGFGNYDNLLFHLDLEGYDVSDPALAAQYIRELTDYRRDQRSKKSILAELSAFKLSDAAIGAAIGMPRSTVQAMATGRVVEKFSKRERTRLVELVRELREVCDEVLDRLGVTK